MNVSKLNQLGEPSGDKPNLSLLQLGTKVPHTKIFDDESIIRQTIRKNPEKGFEMIYKKYYNRLCSHSLRYVYSSEAAKDIINEVFLKLWRNEVFCNVKTTYKSYLFTAVRNRSIDYIRGELGLNKHKELNENHIETQKDLNDPQSIMLLNELINKISVSIDNFSPQCQRVFLLSRIEGKKNKEIAEQLNINIKTVEAHMMKALGSLRKVLADYL